MGTTDASLRHDINLEDIDWLREATEKQLLGCRVQGNEGVWLHTPDGVGNYKALWTRDIQYIVEHAGDLLDPQEIRASILYLLGGQRADGCMPDRVNVAGQAIYSPGAEQSPLADHALDNGPFLALLVCSYLDLTDDTAFFTQVEPALRRGLDHTRRDESGLVYTTSKEPQCPYGFTDTIAKSGHLLFCSLLYNHACRRMAQACSKLDTGDAG